MAKKSASETKKLDDSCVAGTKKDLEGGGFTCTDKDGKSITCIPNNDTTSNCWVSSVSPPPDVLNAFIQTQKALRVVEAALEKVISPDPEY